MRTKISRGFKKVLIIYGGMLLILLTTCVVVYISYNNKVKEAAQKSLLATEKLEDLVQNDGMVFEETSKELSKAINEVIDESKNKLVQNDETNAQDESKTETTVNEQEIEEVQKVETPVKELSFMYPVEGEIIKEFAIDNLVFSETLQEWIVHKGIDIKAPRTTVIKAAEEGTVQAIKNDPRYGLSIIVEHQDGFKTIYSNLLTTEFVTEGEKVSKGQSLGTVGNSAAFEIADEPHLHFEILKNEENVDPKLYLK